MASRPPPVPPAERSKKGPGDDKRAHSERKGGKQVPENLSEQDHQGNIAQNTTNQGYQQDR
jgi:hypothetical protein